MVSPVCTTSHDMHAPGHYLLESSGMCFLRMAASPTMAGAARHLFLCAEFPDISSTPALRSYSGEHIPVQAPHEYLQMKEGTSWVPFQGHLHIAWQLQRLQKPSGQGCSRSGAAPDCRIQRQSAGSPASHRLCPGSTTSGASTAASSSLVSPSRSCGHDAISKLNLAKA